MSRRWYKRCGADFIHATMMLTLEEKGAYSLCLDLIYDRGGPIPDDARWLAGVCGVSVRKWNAIRDRLINLGKLIAEDDHLSNERANLEIISAEKFTRNQAESGAKGGRKRAEKLRATKENNDLGEATLKPIEEIREDKRVRDSADAESMSSQADDPPKPSSSGDRNPASSASRGTKLPSDFTPTLSGKTAAVVDGWPPGMLEAELDQFRDHHTAKGTISKDWEASFRTWARNAEKWRHRNGRNGNGSYRPAGPDLYADRMRDSVLDCLARGVDP